MSIKSLRITLLVANKLALMDFSHPPCSLHVRLSFPRFLVCVPSIRLTFSFLPGAAKYKSSQKHLACSLAQVADFCAHLVRAVRGAHPLFYIPQISSNALYKIPSSVTVFFILNVYFCANRSRSPKDKFSTLRTISAPPTVGVCTSGRAAAGVPKRALYDHSL